MTEFLLERTSNSEVCSQGRLVDPGSLSLVTLELPVKDGLHGSACPEGRFNIRLLPSPKFMRSSDPWVMRYAKTMPHILNVPNRADMMLHWGNKVEATEGCPLVGMTSFLNEIRQSRLAFTNLYDALLNSFVQSGGCWITIKNSF